MDAHSYMFVCSLYSDFVEDVCGFCASNVPLSIYAATYHSRSPFNWSSPSYYIETYLTPSLSMHIGGGAYCSRCEKRGEEGDNQVKCCKSHIRYALYHTIVLHNNDDHQPSDNVSHCLGGSEGEEDERCGEKGCSECGPRKYGGCDEIACTDCTTTCAACNDKGHDNSYCKACLNWKCEVCDGLLCHL
jgi:hypothetical protein